MRAVYDRRASTEVSRDALVEKLAGA